MLKCCKLLLVGVACRHRCPVCSYRSKMIKQRLDLFSQVGLKEQKNKYTLTLNKLKLF